MNAKKFFNENLVELYKNEGIKGFNELYSKVTKKLMFNIHVIDDEYDVFVAFETMNNRGKKLTNLELLKNRLIYLTTLYPDDFFDELDKIDLRKQINNAWKEVYYQLGRNEKNALSDDEFLRAHWICYFSYSRKKGDDYINFLLNKFSSKKIFEMKIVDSNDFEDSFSGFTYDDEETIIENDDLETLELSKLTPNEIDSYVNSLKDLSMYWYDTYFPNESTNLTPYERTWVDKLNRIGIVYFRPLVMVIISKRDLTEEQRIHAFRTIERFIFICFRIGSNQATFRSSEFNRLTKKLYWNEIDLDVVINEIEATTNANTDYALQNYVTKIEKNFDSKLGYYGWNTVRYFLYEYEISLAKKNNIEKLDWNLFTRSERDKVSIEHILPQKPSKYYWRNTYRQFDSDEIISLSGSLGNLLPLSQSINSSLQNDSFEDKKISKLDGRRGYENGSHSEIEVSKYEDWTAEIIYQRSIKLLNFMEKRWKFSFSADQFKRLVYVSFVRDGREIPKDLLKEKVLEENSKSYTDLDNFSSNELGNKQLSFWIDFINYCKSIGRDNLVNRKPFAQNWYDITVPNAQFHLSFTITSSKYITLLIYAYDLDMFVKLEERKDEIEYHFGDKLNWYSSRTGSTAKRILYKQEYDIFNPSKKQEIFDWMIKKYDLIYNALIEVELINAGDSPESRFSFLKQYLQEKNDEIIILSFSQIEEIINSKLCDSAYNYNAYWKCSKTHVLPNLIFESGYDISNISLIDEKIVLKKRIQ
ncbi:DUF4268 domain-containing protein [Erysipelothrix inopinata]|uniref:DUF4268 domain-containing protein n=2 Tax=Erysipelothrix inopinata TaxID=225084 RepID=A0A7G9S1M9_9FIRM|nr:DUF4268 domain-containing protein [Erysipelothrix inopinata]QNN61754.1 DUF4268 domain-containing protein [Erysipelothrix inopinata]